MKQAEYKKGTFEQLEEGSYPARIYQVIELGTVNTSWQGVEKQAYKIRISFEFPTEKKVFNEEKGEQPFALSNEYTLSLHEKSGLRKLIDACDPSAIKLDEDGFIKPYDPKNLIGKTCLLEVKNKEGKDGTMYANIAGAMKMPKGMTCPPPINPPVVFEYENFNLQKFNELPEFIRNKMLVTPEYSLAVNGDAEPFPDQVTLDDIADTF